MRAVVFTSILFVSMFLMMGYSYRVNLRDWEAKQRQGGAGGLGAGARIGPAPPAT